MPKSIPQIKFLRVCEICEALRVNERKVHNLIETGQLRAVDIASPDAQKKSLRIRPEWLDEYVNSRAVVPAPKPKSRRRSTASVPEYV